jgi:D-cysteine desulfhydrase family pyridoxal phosphate-dependent enzyme
VDLPLDRRCTLAHLPTPLEPADRLGAALGLAAGQLWVKRDDCTGLATGGNKVRKLEYLAAEAAASGHDTLVTAGGIQSNHARTTAAAAARLGLRCVVLLAADAPPEGSAASVAGNLALDRLFGAELRWLGPVGFDEMEDAVGHEAERQRAAGHPALAIPVGGSSPTGMLGYVRAAGELVDQLPDIDLVVTADGTGGTHAGLAAGLGDLDRVLGIDVGARPDLDGWLPAAARAAASAADLPPPGGACRVDHRNVGDGYALPSRAAGDAARLAARTEGLVLDPVYTAKAMAGLVAAAASGAVTGRTVFLHTGGAPALFVPTYATWVTG